MPDFWDYVGDPAGALTGINNEGFGGIKKMLFGDPGAVKKAYDDAMNMSRQMGQESKDFLLGQQGKALQYYQPLQHMFQGAYGTEGIQGPQTPQAAPGGAGPLTRMYGGK